MENKDIIKGNKIVAEFMGGVIKNINSTDIGIVWVSIHMNDDEVNFQEKDYPETIHDGSCWKFKDLKYHSSWDWLMPVIGKISNQYEEPEELDGLKYALLCNDIDTAWIFVTSYIESYNSLDINKVLN